MNEVAATLEPKAWDVPEVNQASQQVTPMRSEPVPDDPILAAILAAARDPHVDMEKFKALKAMYDEERSYHSEVEFNAAMQAAQSEMAPVVRDRKNEQTSSNYATIEAIANAITPIYTKHGFSMSFGQGETTREGHLRVTCVLRHSTGHTTEHFADVPMDVTGIKGTRNKTDTHAFGSTMSYGRRYLKLLVWDIATKDDDGNAAGDGPSITPDEADTMRTLVEEIGRTEAQFVNYANNVYRLKMKTLDELPAAKLDDALSFLRAQKQKGAASND